MESQTRILIGAVVVTTLVVVGLFVKPTVDERLAPELVAAWVAIEVAESGIGEIGPVTIEAGTPFALHAVLEAKDREGRSIYYTEVPQLRRVDPATAEGVAVVGTVKAWDRRPQIKVRWFTVEGRRPFIDLSSAADWSGFQLEAFFRADWPDTWSIPGSVDPAFDDHLQDAAWVSTVRRHFGTQRYHARIELYGREDATLPAMRLASWGPEQLLDNAAAFSTVYALLPGVLAAASQVFGLSQVVPPAADPAPARLAALVDQHLAFTRWSILRDYLRSHSQAFEADAWRPMDFGEVNRWGDGLHAGDLLRVGERVVVLFEDRGQPEILDYDDLCFDFVRGAEVRPLGEVFSGEGLVVEHKPITP